MRYAVTLLVSCDDTQRWERNMNGGWEKVQLHFHRSLSKKIWLMPQGQCFYFCNISIYFQWVCIFLLQWPRCYKWDPGWEGNQVSIPSVREGIMNPPPPPHPTTTTITTNTLSSWASWNLRSTLELKAAHGKQFFLFHFWWSTKPILVQSQL